MIKHKNSILFILFAISVWHVQTTPLSSFDKKLEDLAQHNPLIAHALENQKEKNAEPVSFMSQSELLRLIDLSLLGYLVVATGQRYSIVYSQEESESSGWQSWIVPNFIKDLGKHGTFVSSLIEPALTIITLRCAAKIILWAATWNITDLFKPKKRSGYEKLHKRCYHHSACCCQWVHH